MTPTIIAPTVTPIAELRAWLTAAEHMLQRLHPSDPKYVAGLEVWQRRLAEYEARALAEEEPE